MAIIFDKIGRCDNCLKENTRVLVTQSPDLIQGQICLKCFREMQDKCWRKKKNICDHNPCNLKIKGEREELL